MKPKSISKNPVKDSFFIKSFRLLKSNPNKTGLMILFDVLFLISIFALNRLTQYIAPFVIGSVTSPNWASAALFVIFSLIYYLIALFAYSFFKYSVLDSIKSLFQETEFSFKRLAQFYSLNIIIAGIFFAIMLLANFILASIKQDYAPYVFILMAIPYILFLYVIINTSHSLFYEGASVKESIKNGFSITFTKMRTYRETILVMIFLALILWLLFFGSGYFIRLISSKNYSLYLNLYSYFKQASIIAFDLVLYLAVLINRISFYAVIMEKNKLVISI